jgi:dephospho-CoA kinase
VVILGLTGSIGMGKSATAAAFRAEGVPTHDSDAAVHRLYEGPATALIEAAFPGTVLSGKVDRAALARCVLDDPAALKRLEAIVHPLVAADRDAFVTKAIEAGVPVVVLDIPLLFEIGAEDLCDAVVVVSAPEAVQKSRVLSREGMTEKKFEAILAKQVTDAEKRRRAHFLIDTSRGFEDAARQVRSVLRAAASIQPGRRPPDHA